eukprot:5447418-Alexandrium_andersonii.AAC.1
MARSAGPLRVSDPASRWVARGGARLTSARPVASHGRPSARPVADRVSPDRASRRCASVRALLLGGPLGAAGHGG